MAGSRRHALATCARRCNRRTRRRELRRSPTQSRLGSIQRDFVDLAVNTLLHVYTPRSTRPGVPTARPIGSRTWEFGSRAASDGIASPGRTMGRPGERCRRVRFRGEVGGRDTDRTVDGRSPRDVLRTAASGGQARSAVAGAGWCDWREGRPLFAARTVRRRAVRGTIGRRPASPSKPW